MKQSLLHHKHSTLERLFICLLPSSSLISGHYWQRSQWSWSLRLFDDLSPNRVKRCFPPRQSIFFLSSPVTPRLISVSLLTVRTSFKSNYVAYLLRIYRQEFQYVWKGLQATQLHNDLWASCTGTWPAAVYFYQRELCPAFLPRFR